MHRISRYAVTFDDKIKNLFAYAKILHIDQARFHSMFTEMQKKKITTLRSLNNIATIGRDEHFGRPSYVAVTRRSNVQKAQVSLASIEREKENRKRKRERERDMPHGTFFAIGKVLSVVELPHRSESEIVRP